MFIIFGTNSNTFSNPMVALRQKLEHVVFHVPRPDDKQKEVCMYRIQTSRYPDGAPYIRVDLPPLSHSQLYILDCVVDAIWKVVPPQAGPTLVWLPAHSSSSTGHELGKQPKSPGAATPGLEKPTHLSTVKGENNEHGS